MSSHLKAFAKRALSPQALVRLRCMLRGKPLPRWGNFRRTMPFSASFGGDRGTPIDRYYLHRFLDRHRHLITGDVLEIQMPGHAQRFGHELRNAHSIDIDASFAPTFLCDLANSEGVVPSDTYDCFLLPNTLCNLRGIYACLKQALRIVKPGGVILATTAGFVPLTPGDPDYWHLSADGWREVARDVWPACEVVIESHGNCLAAVAAMMGLAHEELTPQELKVQDPRYPVLVTLFCRKPPLRS